jgi:hypothetical protein
MISQCALLGGALPALCTLISSNIAIAKLQLHIPSTQKAADNVANLISPSMKNQKVLQWHSCFRLQVYKEQARRV